MAIGARTYGVSASVKGLEVLGQGLGYALKGDVDMANAKVAQFENKVVVANANVGSSQSAIAAIVARFKATF